MDPTNPYASPEFPNVEPRSPSPADSENVPDVRYSLRESIIELIVIMGVYGFIGALFPYLILQEMHFLQIYLGEYAELWILIPSFFIGMIASLFAGWHTWAYGVRFQSLRRQRPTEKSQS